MHVFVTGASGFVGSAVVDELIAAGHRVTGLARSDEAAAAVAAKGAEVLRGSLTDLDSLKDGTEAADAVIHLGFIHDFTRFAENCEIDRVAILAMGAALKGTDKPMLVTGGTGLAKSGPLGVESDAPMPGFPRKSDEMAAQLAGEGVRAATVRLPQVHGDGYHYGFISMVIEAAKAQGRSAYVGDGANNWCAAHRLDVARVYRLAIERGAQGGPFHAVADEAVPTRTIAEVIGHKLGLPAVSISAEEAQAHFGWLAAFAAWDMATSSAHTRALLGWEPTQIGLVEALETGAYA